MRIFLNRAITLLLLGSSIAPLTFAEKLPTVEEVLTSRGIGLTKANLLEALRNSDAEVRRLAAIKLSLDHATEAVADIDGVLTRDWGDTRSRVEVSFALFQLGEQRGVQTLIASCRDPEVPINDRLLATRYLEARDIHMCTSQLMQAISDEKNSVRQAELLSQLTGFATLSDADRVIARQIIERDLANKEPGTRLLAAGVAYALADSALREPIRRAMSQEGDDNVRKRLEVVLQRLSER